MRGGRHGTGAIYELSTERFGFCRFQGEAIPHGSRPDHDRQGQPLRDATSNTTVVKMMTDEDARNRERGVTALAGRARTGRLSGDPALAAG